MSISRLSERPSFAQRDDRDVLSEGYAQRRLDDADFAARVLRAQHATTLRDLEDLIEDLPRGELPVPVETWAGSQDASGPGTGARGQWSVAAALLVLAGLTGIGVGTRRDPLRSVPGDPPMARPVRSMRLRGRQQEKPQGRREKLRPSS